MAFLRAGAALRQCSVSDLVLNIGVPEPVLHNAEILAPIGREGALTISSSTAIRWSAKTANTPNVFKLGQYKSQICLT